MARTRSAVNIKAPGLSEQRSKTKNNPGVSSSFNLNTASEDDFFAGAEMLDLAARGAVSESSVRLGLADNAGFSGSGPQPGMVAQFQNWNNGASFNQVRVISNQPHLVPRGGLNQLWTRKSDYSGFKVTGEILDSAGQGTGQFIEQTFNPDAGVYDQRMMSRTELGREIQHTLATSSDQLRKVNAQILESTSSANNLGVRADHFADEAYKRARELPGKAISAGATAAITEQYKLGKSPDTVNNDLVWFGSGAAKDAGGQLINEGFGTITSGALGSQNGINGNSIVQSGFGSMLGKSGVEGLDVGKDVGGNILKGTIDKTTGTLAKEAIKATESGVPSSDRIGLMVADGIVDVGFSTTGSLLGGPAGKSAAAVGAEITKIGNAEVGSLILSGREISQRSELGAQQTNGLNILSNTREANVMQDYLRTSGAPSRSESTPTYEQENVVE